MMELLALRDDYPPDGRVLAEVIDAGALPPAMRAHRGVLLRLGQAYTVIEAPVGPFGLDTLKASTRALATRSPGDAVYKRIENELRLLGADRDAAGTRIRAALLGAAFAGHPVSVAQAQALIRDAQRLLQRAAVLGG